MTTDRTREVIVVGGGLAGLSAGIYLGRAMRDTLIVDLGKSMARWEPDVQNYLGFPEGVAGDELVRRGQEQAQRYEVDFAEDEITEAHFENGLFKLLGAKNSYAARRVLLAPGIFHLPPEIEGATACLGHSLFFCKDCDGYRVQGKTIIVYGCNNEAVEYALGLLVYSPTVAIATHGRNPKWDATHAKWVGEYQLPVYDASILRLNRCDSQIQTLVFADGTEVEADALFTTRGDVYFNKLAKDLGAEVNSDGEIVVNGEMATTIKGLYAAGCVTPANCQMIIAAGQGATAAQAINRNLFLESLNTHSLRRFRSRQLLTEQTVPTEV